MRRSNFDLETLIERMMGEVVENTDEPSFGEGQRSHQLPRSALAVAKAKTLLNQNANRFDGPSAAHLSAWHRFLLKQLTELVQFVRLQVTLAMLPSPARIILQAVQAFLLVGLRESD